MLIDHTNYSTTLKQSTTPRGSTPNGNVYFDVANNSIQLISSNELAQINFGAGLVANPLSAIDGITMRALYNFENQERRLDENLRKYKRGTDGDYRYAGAFNFVNGVKLDGTDRSKIRGSGFIEYASTGDGQSIENRVYHGVRSLNSIRATTVPYWALVTATDETTLQAATWTNFSRPGSIDEVVQVFGDATNGNFDYKLRTLVVRVRSWGYNPGETTSTASGIFEFSGFSGGYGVGETINSNNTYLLSNVYTSRISPWTGMTLTKVNQNETGFTQGAADFTWVLSNTLGGSVQECAAYLDALSIQGTDIDTGATTYIGTKGRIWYTRNAAGLVVTSQGLLITGLSTSEKQNVIMTDNLGAQKTYPYYPDVQISVGAAALADPLAWYQVFYADGASTADFDTSGAVTVNDKDGIPVKGNVQANQVGGKISFAYAYDTNTQAGLSAGVPKDMVVLVEGDGIAGQALSSFTVTRIPIVSITCAPPTDNNA